MEAFLRSEWWSIIITAVFGTSFWNSMGVNPHWFDLEGSGFGEGFELDWIGVGGLSWWDEAASECVGGEGVGGSGCEWVEWSVCAITARGFEGANLCGVQGAQSHVERGLCLHRGGRAGGAARRGVGWGSLHRWFLGTGPSPCRVCVGCGQERSLSSLVSASETKWEIQDYCVGYV